MTITRALGAYVKDRLLGPRCALGCGHRARGPRTLAGHYRIDHAGEKVPT